MSATPAGHNDLIKRFFVATCFKQLRQWSTSSSSSSIPAECMKLPASIINRKIPKEIRFCLYLAHLAWPKKLTAEIIEGVPPLPSSSSTSVATANATTSKTDTVLQSQQPQTVSDCLGTFVRECVSRMHGASLSFLTVNQRKLFVVLCGVQRNPFAGDVEQDEEEATREPSNKEANDSISSSSSTSVVVAAQDEHGKPEAPKVCAGEGDSIVSIFGQAHKKIKNDTMILDAFYVEQTKQQRAEEEAREKAERVEKLKKEKEEAEAAELLRKQQKREDKLKKQQQQQQQLEQQKKSQKQAPSRRPRGNDDARQDDCGSDDDYFGFESNKFLATKNSTSSAPAPSSKRTNTNNKNNKFVLVEDCQNELDESEFDWNVNDNEGTDDEQELFVQDSNPHLKIAQRQGGNFYTRSTGSIEAEFSNGMSNQGVTKNKKNEKVKQDDEVRAKGGEAKKQEAEPSFSRTQLKHKIFQIVQSIQTLTVDDLPSCLKKTGASEIGTGWTVDDMMSCVEELRESGCLMMEAGVIFCM